MADLSQDADFAGAFSNPSPNSTTTYGTTGTNLANDPDFADTFGAHSNNGKVQSLTDLANSYNKDMLVPPMMTPTSALQYQGQQLNQTPVGKAILNTYANALVPAFDAGGLIMNALTKPAVYGALNAGLGALQNPNNPYGSAMLEGAIGAGGGLISAVSPLLKYLIPTQAAKYIQDTHDALKNQAESAFKDVSDAAADRGIDQIPIDNSLLERVRGYFPNTKSSNALINEAQDGNYNALRNIQSDLWTRATKAKGSDFIADNNMGDEMMEARDDINNAIANHFQETGNDDLANKLNGARSDWLNLNNTYYSHPTIAKMVDPITRKIPDNIMSVLNENSIPMKNLINANQGIQNSLNVYKWRKPAAVAGGLGVTGAGLYHYLKD